MILKLNHVKSEAAGVTQEVTTALYSLMEEGQISEDQFGRLRVRLDWIQYQHNFRDAVAGAAVDQEPGDSAAAVANQAADSPSRPDDINVDLYIDARQIAPGSATLKADLLAAVKRASRPAGASAEDDRFYLEEFKTFRQSIAWNFNSLYWRRLDDWERSTGRSYETALPGGQSDGNLPEAIADSVADFWTLLQDLEKKKQLPAEVFMLEIGVGSGLRCGRWLDRFKVLDQHRGTNFYPKLRVLLGDYSLATLDMSRPNVKQHIDLCSFMVLDAMNPLKTLAFLRHKVMYVQTTNMYDNLPDEEILRRDGHFYLVQSRSYLPGETLQRLCTDYGQTRDTIQPTLERMLEGRKDFLGDSARGMTFWKAVWAALRVEERLVRFENLPDSPLPAGLDIVMLEDILKGTPDDLRFHLNSGALESFINTLPLLHSRGYLQVQDIFVTNLKAYSMGFYGPGKLDGSVVNWVNGALMKGVAEKVGYDVHFAPFRYRKGSKTSILYTTPRE